MKRLKKAVFLDRDGIINKKPPEHDYIKKWEEFKFITGIEKFIKKLNAKNYLVIVVTNQRGIGRGLLKLKDLELIHTKMINELKIKGAKIDAVYFCPHNIEDNCSCRKPKPGMILKAAEEHRLCLKSSILIGDSDSDIAAGKAAGCKTFLVKHINDLKKIRL